MSIVVDASVALKWVVDEGDGDVARAIFETTDELFAPDFLLVEVANVLWKKVRRQEITRQQAERAIVEIEAYFDEFVPTAPLVSRALSLSIEIDHPVYDCLYLACAEKLDATLITDDQRLLGKTLGLSAVRVKAMADAGASPSH